jgi:hypothetical protein
LIVLVVASSNPICTDRVGNRIEPVVTGPAKLVMGWRQRPAGPSDVESDSGRDKATAEELGLPFAVFAQAVVEMRRLNFPIELGSQLGKQVYQRSGVGSPGQSD